MARNLDYSALNEPVTKTDIDAFKRSGLHDGFQILNAVVIVVLIVLIILVAPYVLPTFQSGGFSPESLTPIVTIGVLFVIVWQLLKSPIKRHARLYKFALRNNLTLMIGTSDPSYIGMIFDEGHSRQIEEAIRFGDGTEIGNYTYVTGSGKSQRTHDWAYVKVKLVRRLPHMVLDARRNNFWKFSNLSDSFDRSQTLELEGDFSKYFTLYAPRQYERDALYVFTPDVMAAMIDYGQEYDMEIVDDELYIYGNQPFSLDKPEFYDRILKIINTIGSELISQTDYYADERIGNRTANIIAPEGQRLKTSFGWMMAVFIVILIYFNIIHPLLFR